MEGIDQYSQYGLVILGIGFLVAMIFFKKLISFILILGVIGATIWFFFIK